MDATSSLPPLASQHFTDAVVGTVIVGWTVQLMLYGFACSSFLAYLDTRAFRNDTLRVKILLMTVMTFLTLQSAISMFSVWHYSTNQHRDEDTFYSQTVADCFATGPVAVVGGLIQGFLAYRASSLFKNRMAKLVFRSFIGLCITLAFLGAILYIALSWMYREGKEFPPHLDFGDAVGIWLWCNACIDIFITGTLLLVLRKKIMHWNEATDNVIRRLMRLAVQTAVLPMICAVCGAALAFSFSNESTNSIYQNAAGSFYQPLSSLYTISLLATLSSRGHSNSQRAPETTSGAFSFTPYLGAGQPTSLSRTKSNRASGRILTSHEEDEGVGQDTRSVFMPARNGGGGGRLQVAVTVEEHKSVEKDRDRVRDEEARVGL